MQLIYLHNRLTDTLGQPEVMGQVSVAVNLRQGCMGYVVLRGVLLTTSVFGLEHVAALVSVHKSTTVLLQVIPVLVL